MMEAVSASAGPSSSSSTNTRNPWPLKQLLKAGYELLQPPSPLSRDPVSLRRQLERSDATLPDELYKNSQDKWCDCGGTPGGGHARDTTEDLRCLIVSRTQYLLVEMQRILEKEYRQVDLRGGLLPDDFLLGTGDLRLIRTMISLIMDHCLARLNRLIPHIAEIDYTQLLGLGKTVTILLELCETPRPSPSSRASDPTVAGNSTDPDQHSLPRLPPTAITQHVHLHYIPKIILACMLVVYPPTIAPKVFAELRTKFRSFYHTEGTTNTMLGHSVVAIRLATAKDPNEETGWNRVWPRYAVEALSKQLDDLVARPGGVKALIYNVMGADAIAAQKMPSGIQLKTIFHGLPKRPRPSDAAPDTPDRPGPPIDKIISQLKDIVDPQDPEVTSPEPFLHIATRLLELCRAEFSPLNG